MAAMWERATLFGLIRDAPELLPEEAQKALWYRLASYHSNLLASECASVVALIDEAWLLAERHNLPRSRLPAAASAAEDNVAWFASLRVAAQRWLSSSRSITRAELPHRLATTLPAWRALLPARIRLTPAFATDPALTRLWQSIAALGVDVAAVADLPSHPQTLPTVERTRDPEHDRHRALCWADEMLASRSHDEVTLIVPSLGAERDSWRRELRQRFCDEWWQAPERDSEHFNLSLGQSLAAYPFIQAMLVLHSATVRPVAVETLAQALTHPRWGAAPGVVASIHRRLQEHVACGIAESVVSGWPVPQAVQTLLSQLVTEKGRRRRREEHRSSVDAVVNGLNVQSQIPRSDLYQLDEAWVALLRRWQQLDQWFPSLDWGQAISELSRVAAGTVFQPKAGKARLQVIGLLESAGVPLSCARLVGISDSVLPEAFSPNPLLPRGWQSAQNVGLGSRAEVMSRSLRLIQNWRTLVGQLSASCPQSNDDGEVGVSPLLHAWPIVAGAEAPPASRRAVPVVSQADELLPNDGNDAASVHPLSASRLREQAQCPRRAAAIRLGLKPWPTLSVGITPMVRGNLVHGVLAAYGSARMASGDARAAGLAQLTALIDQERQLRPAIADVVWQTEHSRIANLLERVIQRDQQREHFAIVAIEQPISSTVAGQRFEGKLDRIDDDGHIRVIFDYKTGKVSGNDWAPDKNSGRLADPQLPLYALMHEAVRTAVDVPCPPVRGIAWFTVNDDSVDCVGVGDDDDLLPARKRSVADELGPWDNALATWQAAISDLVGEWRHGVADVAPIHGELTCRNCEYGSFCRERWSLSASDDSLAGAVDSGVEGGGIGGGDGH